MEPLLCVDYLKCIQKGKLMNSAYFESIFLFYENDQITFSHKTL